MNIRFPICCFICLVLLQVAPGLVAQTEDILTAESYFDLVSEQYGKIEDYEAQITISRGESVMKGTIFYKVPHLLRIDFTDPEEQVLVVDGEALTIYIPRHSVIMHQQLKKRSSANIATMASQQGLQLLKRNYSVAFVTGPDPVPLDEDDPDSEMVVQLQLTWRNTDEGFRQLEISVADNYLIRRIIGVTVDYEEIQFDFEGIIINQDIPDARFEYESPADANVFQNFLFEPEE